MILEVPTVNHPVDITIRPPGSKSLTNRALICAAMAVGESTLTGALESEDTQVMIESLRRLGIAVQLRHHNTTLNVLGCDGEVPVPDAELFVANSGTTIRFLTALLGLAGGKYRLDGIARMRERPIGPLVESLRQLGAVIETESPAGCPPVSIASARVMETNTTIEGNVSSQYLSGLLMGAPATTNGLSIQVVGELVSRPYIDMTLQVMRAFGIAVDEVEPNRFLVPGDQQYQASNYSIEPDASAASYFWGAAAICGGSARVVGLSSESLQGDVGFVDVLAQMGCTVEWQTDSVSVTGPARRGVDVNMADISDTVQTLAAVALFVQGPTRVRGVAHNRVKETDRIGNLAIELRKLGATVDEFDDGLEIHPPEKLSPASIATYNDHRMAMSFGIAGLRQPGVRIENPRCVEKTFPDYFEVLKSCTET